VLEWLPYVAAILLTTAEVGKGGRSGAMLT
jgi:hypothetical protein